MNNPFESIETRLDRIENALRAASAPAEHDPYPPILNVSQAAEILGYSVLYVYQLSSRGQIPHLSTTKGVKLRFSRDILRRWVQMGTPKDSKAITELNALQK